MYFMRHFAGKYVPLNTEVVYIYVCTYKQNFCKFDLLNLTLQELFLRDFG